MSDDHRGVRLGTKVAMIVSQAIVATHKRLLSTKHRLAMMIFHVISDEISAETQYVLGPTLERLLAHPGLHPDMRPHIEFLAHHHGQLSALAGSSLSASGILSSIAQVMNNLLAPSVHELVSEHPFQIPDAGTIAEIMAKGINTGNSAQYGMAANGFDNEWARDLIESVKSYPSPADATDMMRRQLITRSEFDTALIRNGVPQAYLDAWFNLAQTPLSPADAALALLRGNISQAKAEESARDWGVSPDQFNVLVGNTGEPIGLMQLLEAFRRGFIDEARLTRGILQSRIRNEWIDVAIKLRYSPMSVADAVNAVVQNHMTQADGEKIAEQNGLEPGAFATLYETAGEPLSRTEMSELYNRGLVTASDVKQALRESRVKNKYIDDAFALHERLLEPRMLSEAVRYGSVTHADAVKLAIEYGFTQQSAEILVNFGSMSKLQTYRERVVAAAETLYSDNAISQQTATDIAKSMGFDPTEATFIFQAAEFHRQSKLVGSAISAIRSKFISHHIAQSEASGYLDALGVPSAQRDELINLWSVESAANVRLLTPAQIVKAVKLQLITADEGLSRLVALGYSASDGQLLIEGA